MTVSGTHMHQGDVVTHGDASPHWLRFSKIGSIVEKSCHHMSPASPEGKMTIQLGPRVNSVGRTGWLYGPIFSLAEFCQI
jgi:hypothetical protein